MNSAWDIGAKHDYKFLKGDGKMRFNMRNSGIGAAQAFAQVSITSINENRVGRLKLHTRVFAQFGTGETPRESQLFLAGASPEDMMESKYDRSAGFIPLEWQGYGTAVNHYQMGGGLGLRGYAGYLAPELAENGNVVLGYRGNSGGAINAELDVDGLIRLRPKPTRNWLHIDAYLFGDVGSMGYRQVTDQGTSQLRFAAPRADAGAGIAITIKKFWKLVDIKPLTLRFDAPLFLSNIPAGETDHLAFRYVLGINRSF
ncbi:MAG: hypothetical protein IPP33_12015 [Flavobacteriales bacterium]|nr:hypothetical protein [Flavobacteriales bacterium]